MAQRITWETDGEVRKLPAPADRPNQIYGHAKIKRLGIRVTKAGARSGVVKYARGTVYTIGSFPSWDAKQLAEEGKRLNRLIDSGIDPQADKAAKRDAPTMVDLAREYVAYATPRKRPRSLAEDKAILDRVILPVLGKERVASLERREVVKLFNDVSKRAPVRANRVTSLLHHMFELAETEFGMREGPNPARGIERNPETRRTRYLEPAELTVLLTAIGAHRNQRSANIVRLALLTGARRGELLGATWPQFNLDIGTWTRPASLTKQKKTHTVPINGPARVLLVTMKAAADLEDVRRTKDGLPPVLHLFPGYGDNDAQGDLKRTWRSICKSAGLSDLRFHDLRHSFASFLVSSGHNLPLIGQMLGHSNPSTTNRYAHLLLDPQREAAERIGAIVTGAGEKAEVVPMARREA